MCGRYTLISLIRLRKRFTLEDDWLNPTTPPEALAGMLVSYDPEQMLATRVQNLVYQVGRETAIGSVLRSVR